MTPGFSQPLLSSHCSSSPKPRSLLPHGRAGASKRGKKTPARTKDLPHLAEAARQHTSPAPRWQRGNAQASPLPARSGSLVSLKQARQQRRDQDAGGFTAPGGSWRGELRPHARTQGRSSEPALPKRLWGQPSTQGCSSARRPQPWGTRWARHDLSSPAHQGPATPAGAGNREEGAGRASGSSQPSPLQHSPKGSCVYSASHPESCRGLLPGEGQRPGQPSRGCSTAPGTRPPAVPRSPSPAARLHAAAGARSHEARVLLAPATAKPGASAAASASSSIPAWWGRDPRQGRDPRCATQSSPGPLSRGSGMLPELGPRQISPRAQHAVIPLMLRVKRGPRPRGNPGALGSTRAGE